jgi:RIO kinase 1
MTDHLTPLLTDGIIDEVVSRLKSGKEADIYLVRRAGETLAAKVYKDRQARSFKNNAAYKEGRSVRNTRTRRAMQKGSRFGRDADEQAWKTKESEALHTLYAAGVRVPKPDLLYEGVLLMEVVVDAEGRPAPRLVDADLSPEQAVEFYAELRQQVISLLRSDLIHGDLSPYNVLMGRNGPTLIDFPQVIGAAHNSQAERFFQRDLKTLRQFLASKAPALQARAADASEIWRAYVRRELTPGFVPRAAPGPVSRPAQRKPVKRGRPSAGDAPKRSPGPVVTYVGQPVHAQTATPPGTKPFNRISTAGGGSSTGSAPPARGRGRSNAKGRRKGRTKGRR